MSGRYVCFRCEQYSSIFFFFQAEDGIRDGHVTGVQTCALPICTCLRPDGGGSRCAARSRARRASRTATIRAKARTHRCAADRTRSEERRVGKEGRYRWAAGDRRRNRDTARGGSWRRYEESSDERTLCMLPLRAVFVYLFFFSSRRRHTRWPRDWSSDVCSSDLYVPSPGWWRFAMRSALASTTRIANRHHPGEGTYAPLRRRPNKIGRASCRERGEISVGGGR